MSNGSEHIDENHRDDTPVAYLTEQDGAARERATTPGVIYVHDEDDAE